jgi:hypothetical protein
MLCDPCEKLALPTNVAGSCRSCTQHTQYFAYKLCDECSETLDQCERCEKPLNAPASSLVQPGSGVLQVMLADSDAGKTFSGLKIGEEIVVKLEEDQYSQTEWGVKSAWSLSPVLKFTANNGFTPYTGQYQKGTRELVFEVIGTGQVTLELEEKVRQYSWYRQTAAPSTTTAPNGKAWSCVVKAS